MRNNSGACVGKKPVDHPPTVPPSHVMPPLKWPKDFPVTPSIPLPGPILFDKKDNE
jgi:hypothetical protein